MSVTVSEILIAARGGYAAVSPETAGYLVLGAADCLGEGVRAIGSVYLDEDGSLRLDGRFAAVSADSETSLRNVLKRLLEMGRSPSPALTRVAGAREKRGMRRLITEIEAALIPVNRSAGRRALARLERDVSRAKVAGKLGADVALLPDAELALPAEEGCEAAIVEKLVEVPPVVAVEPAPLLAAAPIELSTPVVPGVEDLPRIPAAPAAAAPLFAPVVTAPEPASWTDFEPEATPFLGSVASVAMYPAKSAPTSPSDGEPDTDPAPPVMFDGPPDSPRIGETAILGTYGIDDSEPSDAPPRQPTPYVGIEVAPLLMDGSVEERADVEEPAATEAVSAEPEAAESVASKPPAEEAPNDELDGLEAALFELFRARSDSAPEPAVESAPPPIEPGATSGPFEPVFEFAIEASAAPPRVEEAAVPLVEDAAASLVEDAAPMVSDFAPIAPEFATVLGLGVKVAPVAEIEVRTTVPVAAPPVDLADADDSPVELTPSSPILPAVTPAPVAADPYRPRRSDVADLVAAFVVAESRSLTDLSRELKRIAGIGGTPAPPGVAPGHRK